MRMGATVAVWIGAAAIFCGCGTAGTRNAPMSVKDEARYAAAIEASADQGYQIIGEGEMLTVDTDTGKLVVRPAPDSATKGDKEEASSESAESDMSNAVTVRDGGRTFDVLESVYRDFFSKSPAVILSRVSLEPIQDGTNLLGYRIVGMDEPFEGVDLRVGDIVVGLNGKAPKTPDVYFETWQESKSTGVAIVNIQRDLERYELRWQIKR